MHEGDHSILGHEHEHDHNAHPDDSHQHSPAQKSGLAARTLAAVIVASGVAIFLVWRFL